MDANKRNKALRSKRHRRIRRKLAGSAERPRLCVYRSNKHIYVQVVDDQSGRSLLTASTLSPEIKNELEQTASVQAAARVGELIGQKCLDNGITKIVFDRGGFKYHGRVKALAEAARKRFADAGAEGF